MKKEKKIELKIDQSIQKLCDQYKIKPEDFFAQLQKDLIGKGEEDNYESILAQLYLAEVFSKQTKVDRASVEEVLEYMKSYNRQLKKEASIPIKTSTITQTILEECKYEKNHSKN